MQAALKGDCNDVKKKLLYKRGLDFEGRGFIPGLLAGGYRPEQKAPNDWPSQRPGVLRKTVGFPLQRPSPVAA